MYRRLAVRSRRGWRRSHLPLTVRIGVVDQLSPGWPAGGTYAATLARSLAAACQGTGLGVSFLSRDEGAARRVGGSEVEVVVLTGPEHLPGERWLRRCLGRPEKGVPLRGETRLRHLLGLPDRSNPFSAARRLGIRVLLPLLDLPSWDTGVGMIGWIPDFQHLHLPELFSRSEWALRERNFRRLARRADLVILSSRAALADFLQAVPAHAAKVRVVPFPSRLAFERLPPEAGWSVSSYHLPRKFALVANQFWRHKNHRVVVEAAARLKRQSLAIPVVMTGLPADTRDPANEAVSETLQAIAAEDLSAQVLVLGQVPESTLVDLMRCAALVIQPSCFEGWSTVVQDAKALGQSIICSDLPVLREQMPSSLGFFPAARPDVLAERLAELWPTLVEGPQPEREAASLEKEREFARRHGELLLAICREAWSGS